MEDFNRKDFMLEMNQAKKLTTKQFIEKAKSIYGDRFDYSKTEYVNARTKILVTCKIHGEHSMLPHHHTNGTGGGGCPECGKASINIDRKFTQEQFLEKVKDLKGLSFNKSVYKDKRSKIIVTCNIHGDYETTPDVLFKNCGCPKCKSSEGEKQIEKILKDLKIPYFTQQGFKGLSFKRTLKFDFYLPLYNCCIEFDGEQHFKSVDYWKGEKGFKDLQIKDKLKSDFCHINDISLLRIRFDNQNIQETIEEFLKKIRQVL